MKLAAHEKCSGCTACQSICPKAAITMVVDGEGFIYPDVDEAKCVKCGLCEETCPSMNRDLSRRPIAVYAAKAKDNELRLKSSSGGVFSLLARQVLAHGGIVYGAGFDHIDWHVVHKSAENEDELEDLRGSKYVQSDVQGVYAAVRSQLLAGREVLFTGTPCQVAGLRRYLNVLRVDVSKLFLVDVVCHGVPSPKVWQKYLKERAAALAEGRGSAPTDGRNIRRISFRHKNCGWKRYSLSLRFANDKEYLCEHANDSYMRAFLGELCNRPSCHACNVRQLKSGSDLTLADYWNVSRRFPGFDDDLGVSLFLVNSAKGREIWDGISSELISRESDYDDAVRVNPALEKSCGAHSRRSRFFKRLKSIEFDELVKELLPLPLWRKLVRRVMSRIGRMLAV